jgi:hypothetical protein
MVNKLMEEKAGRSIMEAVEFGTFAHNGIIEIPIEYRNDYSTDIRVILMKNKAARSLKEPDMQERLAAAERLVGIASKNAMTLEEIKTKDWLGNENYTGYQCSA